MNSFVRTSFSSYPKYDPVSCKNFFENVPKGKLKNISDFKLVNIYEAEQIDKTTLTPSYDISVADTNYFETS